MPTTLWSGTEVVPYSDRQDFQVDVVARDMALRRWVLPECLHVPVAAADVQAIETYIGEVIGTHSRRKPPGAVLVRAKPPSPLDRPRRIFSHAGGAVLHAPLQVWVHIAYTRYRAAYRRGLPDVEITGKVLAHSMNRRVAVLKGFDYVRIFPVRSAINVSSAFSERWAVSQHSPLAQLDKDARRKGAFIQYADIADLMVMMDMQVGGGVMEAVNAFQELIDQA